jgi:hypothetical protein
MRGILAPFGNSLRPLVNFEDGTIGNHKCWECNLTLDISLIYLSPMPLVEDFMVH